MLPVQPFQLTIWSLLLTFLVSIARFPCPASSAYLNGLPSFLFSLLLWSCLNCSLSCLTCSLSVHFCSPCFTCSLHSALCCPSLSVCYPAFPASRLMFCICCSLSFLSCFFVTVQLYSLSCLAIKPSFAYYPSFVARSTVSPARCPATLSCLKKLTNFLANFLSFSIISSDNGDCR